MTEGTGAVGNANDRAQIVVGVDTCGPAGSVALARVDVDGQLQMQEQIELAGKTYSAALVAAVGDLLNRVGAKVAQIDAIAVTHGPGSFTGVRVGLSAVKGLAEPTGIPVVAVSRLAVLAQIAGTEAAALDAHRHEVFLRLPGEGTNAREVLASRPELEAIGPVRRVATCDDAAAELLAAAWPRAELVRIAAPTATDLIRLAVPKIRAGQFADLVLLDGHYLRRSDAEIFGGPAQARRPC